MYYPAYVLLSVEEAKSSLEARQKVMAELSKRTRSVGSLGNYPIPVCDWFVIGGSWSGLLNPGLLRSEFYRQARQLQPTGQEPNLYRDQFANNNREQLDEIWHKLGGNYASPLTRDQLAALGEEDDARLLDEQLAEQLNNLCRWRDKSYLVASIEDWFIPAVITLSPWEYPNHVDFDTVMGDYWVVVIEYRR